MQTKQLKYLTVAAAPCSLSRSPTPPTNRKIPPKNRRRNLCAHLRSLSRHLRHSNDSAFPGLAGMDHQVFVREMKRFRSKDRPSSIMSHIADGYNDSELERMAASCRFTKET